MTSRRGLQDRCFGGGLDGWIGGYKGEGEPWWFGIQHNTLHEQVLSCPFQSHSHYIPICQSHICIHLSSSIMAPSFEDADLAVNVPAQTQTPLSPKARPYLPRLSSRNAVNGNGNGNTLSVSAEEGPNAIEVPATRSQTADAQSYMHNLSLSPSMKDRRGSRNSFGASLPIPRSKRQSRLSSVHYLTRPGMPPIQASRDILAAKVQDMSSEKVLAAKNMAFVFDIDGVLVHGDRLIPEGMFSSLFPPFCGTALTSFRSSCTRNS